MRLGEHDYNNNNDGANHEDIPVVDVIQYPDYVFPQAYHDLALLRLQRKVKLQVRPFIFLSFHCLHFFYQSFDMRTSLSVSLSFNERWSSQEDMHIILINAGYQI